MMKYGAAENGSWKSLTVIFPSKGVVSRRLSDVHQRKAGCRCQEMRDNDLKLCPAHHAAQMSRTVASGMETDKLRTIGPGQI